MIIIYLVVIGKGNSQVFCNLQVQLNNVAMKTSSITYKNKIKQKHVAKEVERNKVEVEGCENVSRKK